MLLGLFAASLISGLLRRRHRRKPFKVGELPLHLEEWDGPIRALAPALLSRLVTPALTFPESIRSPLNQFLSLWIIVALAWLARRTVTMVGLMIMSRYPVEVEDNLEARRVQTQVRVVERVLTLVIVAIAVAAILMTFEEVRQFGVSLLASAGVAGIVIGFAAQKSLGTLLAGIQIAMSQPIRIDDVVIVEGEWGRIEEITLTFVVVRIWDERRLVVPITYFLDNVFENWTRTSAQLLGTVFVYADYAISVDRVRSQLKRILDNAELWDGRVWGLQVTDASEKTVELRALMSAENSSKAWDLRCHVREELIHFLQQKYPQSLPKVRIEKDPVIA
jgi:hypothetical protein